MQWIVIIYLLQVLVMVAIPIMMLPALQHLIILFITVALVIHFLNIVLKAIQDLIGLQQIQNGMLGLVNMKHHHLQAQVVAVFQLPKPHHLYQLPKLLAVFQ